MLAVGWCGVRGMACNLSQPCSWSARNTAAGTPMHGGMEEAVGVFERELYSHVGQALPPVPAAAHRAAVRRHSRTQRAEIQYQSVGRMISMQPTSTAAGLCGSVANATIVWAAGSWTAWPKLRPHWRLRACPLPLTSSLLVLAPSCRRFPGDWHRALQEELLERCPSDSRVATLLLANC